MDNEDNYYEGSYDSNEDYNNQNYDSNEDYYPKKNYSSGGKRNFDSSDDNYPRRNSFVSGAAGKGKKQKVNRCFGAENYEEVEPPGKGRDYTLSIAVPASILEETCLLDELRTYVVGQVARAANIFSVDEIVVYDDGCWRKSNSSFSRKKNDELIRKFYSDF